MGKVGVVIVAAGISRRMGGAEKIFADLSGKPLITYSIDIFQSSDKIDQIVLVLHQQNQERGRQLVRERSWSKVSDVCAGGQRRQDSVKEGLRRLSDCKWVAIHDGARPLVTNRLITDGLKAAQHSGAAVPAIPVKDTIKDSDKEAFIQKTLPRERLWAAQTPQIFRFDIINEAYAKISGDVTDDASMVEALGYKVKIFPGSTTNIKVTTPEDLIIAEAILSNNILS